MDQLPIRPGAEAHAAGNVLSSTRIGALPILDHFLRRLRLDEFLRDHLLREDRRLRLPTATALTLFLKNILIAREPLYGVGEWAARHDPHWLGLAADQVAALNDDRVGRALDRLFDADIPSLTLAVVARAVREFNVNLDELHNDSTTVTLHGDYEAADHERTLRGRLRLAVKHGHNKDHRPDLKQLLYILTVSRDGAVPVQFRVESGNATDDKSHRGTWDLLCQITGRPDFLYVADCKLATAENMAYVHQKGGRFLTVLPRTRADDAAFRATVRAGQAQWMHIHDQCDDEGEIISSYSIHDPERITTEGYRLLWFHSTHKAELDAVTRYKRLERVTTELTELRARLTSSRTRYRERTKVEQAVETILREGEAEGLITVEIQEQTTETYRQEQRGRPSPDTRYIRCQAIRFDLTWKLDHDRLAVEASCDGIFPLVSNVMEMSALDLLLSYKQQPLIEKRFSQLKTDFVVAPVFLKEVSRIQALLCVYFFALLTEALLERELRQAMERAGVDGIPLYPEERPCRRPTARRIIDLFEDVQRHELRSEDHPPVVFLTKLTRLQLKVLRLLGMKGAFSR